MNCFTLGSSERRIINALNRLTRPEIDASTFITEGALNSETNHETSCSYDVRVRIVNICHRFAIL